MRIEIGENLAMLLITVVVIAGITLMTLFGGRRG